MDNLFHSVTIDADKCRGCINCVKRCPTEAIRVRDGKAKIIAERCIDCGECVRVCPYHAKLPIYDPLSILDNYKYTIALPAPSLYGQFSNLDDIDVVLGALKRIGFSSVFEVSRAAELVTDITRKLLREGKLTTPIISSACPAILRLIRVSFPNLLGHILPIASPMELAARLSKKSTALQTGLRLCDIGAIFISPCAAKVMAVKIPLGSNKSAVDGVVAIRDVFPKLLSHMIDPQLTKENSRSGKTGIGWASSGGEADALDNDRIVSADGIENVIKVLSAIEDEKFPQLDFVELNACPGGCAGGILNVENPYIAKAKLKRLQRNRPLSRNSIQGGGIPSEAVFDVPIKYSPVMELDSNISVALSKLSKMRKIEDRLFGIDCGSCGAPTCRALAEDIVRGKATEEMCIYKMRNELQSITNRLTVLIDKLPETSAVVEGESSEDTGGQDWRDGEGHFSLQG